MKLNKTVIIRRTKLDEQPLTRGIEFITMEKGDTVMLLPPDCEMLFAGEDNKVEFDAKKRQGIWIEGECPIINMHEIICSECGEHFLSRYYAHSSYTVNKFRCCPHCFAEMRGYGDGKT